MIIQTAGATLAASVKPEELEDAIRVADGLIAHQMQQPDHMRALVPKLSMVRQNLAFRAQARDHARSMKVFGEQFVEASKVDVVELNEQVADSMANLGRLRKYGLKPSYFANGFLIKADQAWAFADPQVEGVDHPMLDNFLADIKLYDDKDVIAGLTTEYGRQEFGKDAWLTTKPVPLYQSIYMLPDGELVISSSTGVIPLRREYQAQGAEATYDLIRFSLITNFVDLVVPKKYSEDLPSTGAAKLGFLNGLRSSLKFANIKDLLVPRLKMLHTSASAIEADLQEEIATSRKQIREHEVIWHIRQLPRGHKASEDALIEARKRGIELEEGETFVKTHTRGNPEVGKIEGYKAKRSAKFKE